MHGFIHSLLSMPVIALLPVYSALGYILQSIGYTSHPDERQVAEV